MKNRLLKFQYLLLKFWFLCGNVSFMPAQSEITELTTYIFTYNFHVLGSDVNLKDHLIHQPATGAFFTDTYEIIDGKKIKTSISNDREFDTVIIPSNSKELYCFNWLHKELYFLKDKAEMAWEIKTDTLTVSGYRCQKALLDFRGRSYVAWFTNEIPIPLGPYKYRGLPGLIVKISSLPSNHDAYQFEYTLTKVTNLQAEPLKITAFIEAIKSAKEVKYMLFEEFHEKYKKAKENYVKQNLAKSKTEGHFTISFSEGKEILYRFPSEEEMKRMFLDQ